MSAGNSLNRILTIILGEALTPYLLAGAAFTVSGIILIVLTPTGR